MQPHDRNFQTLDANVSKDNIKSLEIAVMGLHTVAKVVPATAMPLPSVEKTPNFKDGKTTCPSNTCCSQYGFFGTTKDINNWLLPGLECPIYITIRSTTGGPIAQSHLSYAFAYLDPSSFNFQDHNHGPRLNAYSTLRRHVGSKDYELVLGVLEIFVSIGGWTFSDNDTYTQPVFGNIARSSENRQLVTDEVASFLTYYGFDGVELDW
ncbi:hypothetical protein E4U26_004547 [Claviceps purpurea]|nr:hypothetical protein E4U26_004547 [Claviceps purpurea]